MKLNPFVYSTEAVKEVCTPCEADSDSLCCLFRIADASIHQSYRNMGRMKYYFPDL